MSADNGIYIHKFKDGWRVIHAQAIENIYWWNTDEKDSSKWENRNEINPKVLWDYFKKSPLFKTKKEALDYAEELYEEYGWTEYGICLI